MRAVLLIHIIGGAMGLVTGAVAVYAAKGASLHRKSGKIFVYAMLTMGLTGALIAALTGVQVSVIMGLLTAYLVTTSLTTVRPPDERSRQLNLGAAVLALALGIACITMGFDTLERGQDEMTGMPAPMFFVFGTVALLSAASDIRMMRSGPLQGARRLARHLWRMCFALFIASASFFLGQSDKFPEQLRIMPVLMVLALAPLAVLTYWMWRVRIRKKLRGIVVTGSPVERQESKPHLPQIIEERT